MLIIAHNGARIWGGAERATVALLSGLSERGHDVLLLCNDSLVAGEAAKRGVNAEVCIVGGDIAFHHAFRLSRVLKRTRPDAFIIGTYKKLFHASLAARIAGVPRVIARVGLESDTPRSLKYRFALRRWVDGVVVNANRIADAFRALRASGEYDVRVIPNSVPATAHASRSAKVRLELGIPATAFVIGTVARLAKQKRIDRLVETTSLLDGVHCIIAGDGTRRAEVEAKIRELAVQHRVHLLGNRDDVSDVMDALDVFVVASDSEGLSNAMLEAMERGVPVVSTDVSGAEDALGPDDARRSAGFITPFTASALADAVNRLMRDADLRHAMGEEARTRVATRFSRAAMLSAWEEFLGAR
jgi:glycosyltransferase involved in cell wall biosynthesis